MRVMTLRNHNSGRRAVRGFSLVEIMVGVAIGIIGMLVIFRTIAVWDTHTRSTTAGSDSQSAGSLAMFNLERDIKQAGHGFMGLGSTLTTPPASLGCLVSGGDTGARTLPFAPFNMVPVEIVLNPGQPDTINVLYGDSPFFVSEARFTGSTSNTKTLERRGGFKLGDKAIAGVGANCNLIEVTGDTNPDGHTIDHATAAVYPNFYAFPAATNTARYNSAALPALGALGNIYSLGPNPTRNQWAVVGGSLTNSEMFRGSPPFVVGEGVVNMKAIYGLDTLGLLGTRTVNTWTNVAPTTSAGWAQVLSVRVAMLVRSRQFERTTDQSASGVPTGVTLQAPTWSGAAILPLIPNSNFVMTNVNGSPDSFGDNDPDPNNWRFYRYRVYEKEIPLRNVMWGTTP
jgi:type IV pilus assembly protein PilW